MILNRSRKSQTGCRAFQYRRSLLFMLALNTLTACSTPGYLCPVDTEVGACASQMQAYQRSLRSLGEGESIFSVSGVKDLSDKETSGCGI